MNQIYFEAKGEVLLGRLGISKSEFARQMGIRKQNVKALFKTKNYHTIYKASTVLGVPFEMLIGYIDEPETHMVLPEEFVHDALIKEDDIPTGDSVEDRRKRQRIILSFYHQWKEKNPELKKFNLNLMDDINIKYVSLKETAGHASLTYLSTLAVLQLDAILTNAIYEEKVPANPQKENQKGFESMIRMSYYCPGIGGVKMMVGVKRSDKTKVQYCITAIDTENKQEAQRPPVKIAPRQRGGITSKSED